MASYRIGGPLGRAVRGKTPHALICETCGEEIDGVAHCEGGQEKYSSLTAAGVIQIWPDLEEFVPRHETRRHSG